MKTSLKLQIKVVEREILQRRKVYGRLVGSRKMRQSEMDFGIAQMQAVLNTLVWLSKNEEAVRSSVVASGGEAQP